MIQRPQQVEQNSSPPHEESQQSDIYFDLLFQPKLCITPGDLFNKPPGDQTPPKKNKYSIANVFASGDVYLDGHFLR